MTSPKDQIVDEADAIVDQARSLAELGKRVAVEAEQLESRVRAHEWRDNHVVAHGTKAPTRHHIGRLPVDQELYHRVRKMLEDEPMRFGRLVEATGLTANKVKVLITKMQRDGVKIVNLGAANKAVWFIPSSKVRERLGRPVTEDDR